MTATTIHQCDGGCGKAIKHADLDRVAGWRYLTITDSFGGIHKIDVCADCWPAFLLASVML